MTSGFWTGHCSEAGSVPGIHRKSQPVSHSRMSFQCCMDVLLCVLDPSIFKIASVCVSMNSFSVFHLAPLLDTVNVHSKVD